MPSPLNLGSLPLLVVDTTNTNNLAAAEVSVLQAGTAPEGFDFPEQKIALNGTAEQASPLRPLGSRLKPPGPLPRALLRTLLFCLASRLQPLSPPDR